MCTSGLTRERPPDRTGRVPRPRPAVLLCLFLAALAGAGCGNERRDRLELEAEPAKKTVVREFPRAGVELELPENVTIRETDPPGVFYGSFGATVVSVFAYRRREQLPETDGQLRRALRRLKRATRDRDPDYRLRDSRTTRVAGSRAVELVGDQKLGTQALRTRSVHVYKGKAEYVLELLSPREDFARLDRELFEPALESVRLSGRVRRPSD